jgi:hypothetical protein
VAYSWSKKENQSNIRYYLPAEIVDPLRKKIELAPLNEMMSWLRIYSLLYYTIFFVLRRTSAAPFGTPVTKASSFSRWDEDEGKGNLCEEVFEPLQISCEINGYTVAAIVDTGAQVTVISSACARRCKISNLIDNRMSGKAIGVGSSDIVGCIGQLPMRVGPLSYHNKVAVLRESRFDLIIGLDFIRRFQCDIILEEGLLRLKVRGKTVRIPFIKGDSSIRCDGNINVGSYHLASTSSPSPPSSFDSHSSSSSHDFNNYDLQRRLSTMGLYSDSDDDSDDFSDDYDSPFTSSAWDVSMEGV